MKYLPARIFLALIIVIVAAGCGGCGDELQTPPRIPLDGGSSFADAAACGFKCELEDCDADAGTCEEFKCQPGLCRMCENDRDCQDECVDGFCTACYDEFGDEFCRGEFFCDDKVCLLCETKSSCERGACLRAECADSFY